MGIDWKRFEKNFEALDGPMMISWDITNKCNMNCEHCLNRSNDIETHHGFVEEVTEEECENIINQILEVRPYSICLCGGEPTLSPYLFKMIKKLSSAGIWVNMVSNGYIIDKIFAEKLKKAGLYYIQISVDGVDSKTHDAFRKTKGAFEHAINAIKNLVEQKLMVAVSFCPTKVNIQQFPAYVDMIMELGCKNIRLMPFLPMGRGLDSVTKLDPSTQEYAKFKREIIQYREKYRSEKLNIEWGDPIEHIYLATDIPRPVPMSLEIRSNLDIAPSIYLPISVGNLRKHTIKEYWDGGFDKVWGMPEVMELAKKIRTLEDFKQLSMHTWNIERKHIDILEDKICLI